jgi:hypothetical protein
MPPTTVMTNQKSSPRHMPYHVLSPSVPTPWEYIVAYSIDQGGGTIWRSNTRQVLKTTKTFTLDNQV